QMLLRVLIATWMPERYRILASAKYVSDEQRRAVECSARRLCEAVGFEGLAHREDDGFSGAVGLSAQFPEAEVFAQHAEHLVAALPWKSAEVHDQVAHTVPLQPAQCPFVWKLRRVGKPRQIARGIEAAVTVDDRLPVERRAVAVRRVRA